MKHEPGDAFALGFPGAGTRALQQSGPTPAVALQEALPDLSQLFPVPRSWLSPRTGTGIRGTLGWPGPAPRIPIPLLEVPVPSVSLETHEPGMGEGQQNGLGLLGFFLHGRLFGVEIKD